MEKKFGIDIDGTVTSPSAILPFMNEAFGLNLKLEDIKQYDLTPFVNVSEKEFNKWFKENEPQIYAESPLVEGAADILNKWKNEHKLIFISARATHLLDVTEKWFKDHNVFFNHIELIGTHHKVEAVKKYNVDIFFEDKHDNAVMIHEECKIPVLLFDTPYNQDPIPEGVIRVHNWNEAAAWVENWIKEGK
ncbi:MAG: hypothetical protein Q8934_11420 [Bacillota bacterium]|nr:hypothetical protein [Bacillota bacterium]